ncbi:MULTISPECIES: DUF4275 family protein [unclassified Rhizobacter]|uniref:DUF4275 family protein n=1 Tax=unclassified Rhizobacter TaxID=2640088 RepID=UPI0006F214C0|nr:MULTISPECIES: DUF4275 family protein [unclassified Rhizobacter]KQU67164.1 hypothetical protein ASC88_09130 [Rhizobacter sp. Root29]KQV98125.1 hypothetical protein ASC98_08935 [Rhizobacter sp. Root1238]KRB02023.1 hypothetical protein ASE08_16495 [Rhizobacter sp. Root16D2]
MVDRRLHEPLVTPGRVTSTFTKPEVAALVAQWLEVFGLDRFGVNARAYLWHVFSNERYPSVSGEAAQAAYDQQQAPGYIVLSNDRDLAFTTDQRPARAMLRDYQVFPPNLAWTMSFTHEDGWLGPYFAKHPQYDKLNAANLAKLQKAHDIEAARRKGWM